MTAVEPWIAPAGLAGCRWPARHPRAVLLLQHGYAEHGRRYVMHANRLIPCLAAMGIDVYAFDMAGHGWSAGWRGDTDIRRMVDAHLAARQQIAPAGLPLFLFGHSLGGLVTAASVARAPEGLAGVVLSAPALPAPPVMPMGLLLRAIAGIAPMAGIAPRGNPEAMSRIGEEVAAYCADPLVFQRRLPARLAASALAAMNWVHGGAAQWTAPTLIVHGTADTVTSPQASRQLIGAIRSSDATLDLVTDGRHELLNDLPRDEVLGRILAWIAAHMSEGASR